MRVSLIITTYNRHNALSLVFKSIDAQTKFPDEIIVADDGSNESTKQCIAKFQKSSSIRVIHSWQNDKGFRVAKSRNKALAKSSFEYIILIDGDMVLHNKFIEDHLNHAESGFFVQGSRVLLSKLKTEKVLMQKKIHFHFFLLD
jgi:glycosyltransferase involved in cell wall biosynthesis